MNEDEYERTALDYLNNWRSTQARVSELEAENARLKECEHGVSGEPCPDCIKEYHEDEFVASLQAENKELQHSLDCMVASTWELQEERNFLMQDCDRLRKELDEANGVIR